MKKTAIIFSLLLIVITASAHPWKPKHYVIIDTDGGLDDRKAISMLLASPDVRVIAVTASDGYHKADVACENVRKMLDGFWHEGLPVVTGEEAIQLIDRRLYQESTPVTFIALGSLQTASDAIDRVPSFSKKIRQIIWSNDGLPGKEGLNYRSAPAAAEKVLRGPVPVIVTGNGGEGFYDRELLGLLGEIDNQYAMAIVSLIETNAKHPFVFTAFDELAAIYLHYPGLFKTASESNDDRSVMPSDISMLQKAATAILKGETVKRMQVVKELPLDTAFYMADIQTFADSIQKRYGEDEWVSGVIANELHRHLGVFAIIGVKMGIRAREYFSTGVDEMQVTTMAGSTPPLSCMNDGIQVSTGATPGHGLLTVHTEPPYIPAAEFIYRDRIIRITLKTELAERVLSELREINFVYGLDSDIYWELVRRNSIKYWLQLDRHEIFDIEIIR